MSLGSLAQQEHLDVRRLKPGSRRQPGLASL